MAATTTAGYANTIGMAKQTAQGSANPPSSANVSADTGYWVRWLQGSKVRPTADMNQEWEGDGSRGQSLNYKRGQWGTGKLIYYARPKDVAMAFAAFSGHGSDAHSGSAAPYTHAITPALTAATYDYYTLLQSLGKGSSTVKWQLVDAVCNKIAVTSSAQNPPLKLDTDWLGTTNSTSTGAVTAVLPGDGPFYWFSGSWSLASALAGSGHANWAAALKDISLTFEADLTPSDYIAESITPLPFSPGNLKLTGDATLLWQADSALDAAAYFNGGSTDSPTVATGDLSVTFACSTDATQTLTIDIPNASWTMTDIEPSLDGKPVEQKATLVGLNQSGGIYTITALNAANVGY